MLKEFLVFYMVAFTLQTKSSYNRTSPNYWK